MIPEVRALTTRPGVIRIPHQLDVPITKRIRRIIDSEPFHRLSRISQLGLVSMVYPGATHTRFEHSLGVYRNTLLFVERLSQFDEFHSNYDESHLEALVLAALLHDIGHWSFCHPIEDLSLVGIPDHEDIAVQQIQQSEICELIDEDWNASLELVCRLIGNRPLDDSEKLLGSIISGPIDVDKMDYLYRDSLHCGVPYGMNFDAYRLINAIEVNQSKNGIAISPKGKTAAEMMVFARYVMFSEVYWHHAVRSATAMLQRLFYDWYLKHGETSKVETFRSWDDASVPNILTSDSALHEGLFGQRRGLYKSLLDYNANQNPEIFTALAHQPYHFLHEIESIIGEFVRKSTGCELKPNDLILDAPPPGLEVQFKVEVNEQSSSQSLEDVSPVVNALAKRQFDHFVKRVRVFVHPRIFARIDGKSVERHLTEAIKSCDFKSRVSS